MLPDCQGGVVLQKRFYTEILGPGCALGGKLDIGVKGIYAMGRVELDSPHSVINRQQAFQCRLAQADWIQQLLSEVSEVKRSKLASEYLLNLMSFSTFESIPANLLAPAINVSLRAIAAVRKALLWETATVERELPEQVKLSQANSFSRPVQASNNKSTT